MRKRTPTYMRKSYQLLLVFFVTLASVVAISNSSALEFKSGSERVTCSCTFTGRKDYQLFNETNGILGRRVHRKWTCEYSCDSASHLEKSDKDKVIGSYEMTNRGEDNGLEGICEGTVYESEFSSYVGRDVYTYKSTHGFNPKKAKAKTLKQWAESQGCD